MNKITIIIRILFAVTLFQFSHQIRESGSLVERLVDGLTEFLQYHVVLNVLKTETSGGSNLNQNWYRNRSRVQPEPKPEPVMNRSNRFQ
jgi:hypothetical protein